YLCCLLSASVLEQGGLVQRFPFFVEPRDAIARAAGYGCRCAHVEFFTCGEVLRVALNGVARFDSVVVRMKGEWGSSAFGNKCVEVIGVDLFSAAVSVTFAWHDAANAIGGHRRLADELWKRLP